MELLDTISSPEDLRRLREDQLPALCRELRGRIIGVVTQNGGHLASSLGVVELTVALHYVFESPAEPIVWDVGNQAYAHKLLTGRRERFASLRQQGGLSGFTRRDESEHDAFGAGHASTSISAALGLAEGRRLRGQRGKVVAVIGDGGMTGGLAFEGLNHAGTLERDLVVVLNDNGMFISDKVGAMSAWLSRRLTGRGFNLARRRVKDLLTGFPRWGDVALDWLRRGVEGTKALLTPGILFEGLNFQYVGPVDGHDLPGLVALLRRVKLLDGPVLVHARTVKGRGLSCAEDDPRRFHGVAPYCPDEEPGAAPAHPNPSFTAVFSEALVELAGRDERVVAITAAMPDGTGLAAFAGRFPERFYDVGIAEEHAVTFAAGLACEGRRPVVAIYSTFLQRGFDQLVHDVCLQRLPVVFVLDRAGVVGEDGPTHHGQLDLCFLRCVPNLVVLAPADGDELRSMLAWAVAVGQPVAIRFPRGAAPAGAPGAPALQLGRGRRVRTPAGRPDLALLACGHCLDPALEAAERLRAEHGLQAVVADARFVKPLDRELVLSLAEEAGRLVTVEEGALEGGFGQAVAALLLEAGRPVPLRCLGLPDRFVPHGRPEELRRLLELDGPGIARAAARLCGRG
ncbi:MAG TPA: 1-deoxy-D-xylulose-5-phosphate synthase [Myxococcota bacterium]|nr:1-deoxy-D-xylulose-5-phosphate synthase [Myxococcota bacterium]HRY94329.1 1-deoxy-D-xylulose-5-phosphate synthase [Myxococcota bacterium]